MGTYPILRELQNYNSLLTSCWQENVGSHQKQIPHVQGQRRSPNKMVGGAKSWLRIKCHTCQRHSEGSNKTLCAPWDPTETDPDLPLSTWVSPAEVPVSSGLQRQGLWVQQTWVWHKLAWRRSPLTPPYSHQNLHRIGETGSWRAQTKPFVHQDPGERSSDPTCHECPWVSRSLQWRRGSVVACCRVWGTECGALLKEVAVIFIISTMVWPQVKQQGGNTAPPSTENWIKDLLSIAPPIRTRPSFPLSQSLPSGSFHKPLILLHQRADRLKTTITEN